MTPEILGPLTVPPTIGMTIRSLVPLHTSPYAAWFCSPIQHSVSVCCSCVAADRFIALPCMSFKSESLKKRSACQLKIVYGCGTDKSRSHPSESGQIALWIFSRRSDDSRCSLDVSVETSIQDISLGSKSATDYAALAKGCLTPSAAIRSYPPSTGRIMH